MNEASRAGLLLALSLACAGAGAAVTCRIGSGGAMAFGGYDVLSAAPDDSQARITTLCTRNGGSPNVTLTVQLSTGINGGSTNTRRMRNAVPGGGFLDYNLFRDVGRSAVWGFSSGVDTLSQTLSIPDRGSATATFTIYGRIPALQDAAVGIYFDLVTVTVSP